MPSETTYYLRIRTQDNAGNPSDWTPPPLFTFKYDGTAPGNPAVITETHGVANDTWQDTIDDPDFIWSGATDAGSGVAGYDVYWGTSITGTAPTTWTTSTAYDPPAVPSEAAHYLRVRTQDNAGNPSDWTPFAFKYDVTPPDNPITVDPGCDANDGVWQHTCSNPNFTWSGASDGGSGIAGYNVYWGTSITDTAPATWTSAAAYNPPAVPSGVPHHLRAQTADNVDNWSEWTTLFSLQYDDQPPLISDTIPANGSVITTSWPVISATLTDPQPGSGVQPLSTTLILDSEVVTPQVNTAGGFAYTPTVRLTEGVHTVTAQVYDQADNQTQSGPWSFTVVDDSAVSLGVTKYYYHGSQRTVRPASAARRDRHAPERCGIPWTAWRQPGQASFIATILRLRSPVPALRCRQDKSGIDFFNNRHYRHGGSRDALPALRRGALDHRHPGHRLHLHWSARRQLH